MTVATTQNPEPTTGTQNRELLLTGMTCTACARTIERTLQHTEGVTSASVNFATRRADVRFDPAVTDLQHLTAAVRDVGYDVVDEAEQHRSADQDYQELRRRFVVSLALFVPILIISMAGVSFRGV